MKTFLENYCSKEWLEFVDFHKETIDYVKGDLIFSAGEETKGVFVIDKGKVKITYRQFNGSDLLIRLAGDAHVIGHRGFGGDWTYPITAHVLDKTTVTFIPIGVFTTIAKTNPEFSFQMMIFFAEQLRKSEGRIVQYPVKTRIVKALAENYKVYGFESAKSKKLAYTLSRNDIASRANTTYESVVRTLADLNKDEIIKIDGKAIHLLDLDKLNLLAHPELEK